MTALRAATTSIAPGRQRRRSYGSPLTGALVDLRPGHRSEDRLEGIPRVMGGEARMS